MILLLRDTREQEPLEIKHPSITEVEDICLPFGDYTAMMGKDRDSLSQIPITVERKGFGDLWGTMTSGYERFRKEIHRAIDCKHKFILAIEGSYSDVANGFSRSEFSGESMLKKLATLYAKYGVETWFCESRAVMSHRICETYSAVQRHWEKEGKNV